MKNLAAKKNRDPSFINNLTQFQNECSLITQIISEFKKNKRIINLCEILNLDMEDSLLPIIKSKMTATPPIANIICKDKKKITQLNTESFDITTNITWQLLKKSQILTKNKTSDYYLFEDISIPQFNYIFFETQSIIKTLIQEKKLKEENKLQLKEEVKKDIKKIIINILKENNNKHIKVLLKDKKVQLEWENILYKAYQNKELIYEQNKIFQGIKSEIITQTKQQYNKTNKEIKELSCLSFRLISEIQEENQKTNDKFKDALNALLIKYHISEPPKNIYINEQKIFIINNVTNINNNIDDKYIINNLLNKFIHIHKYGIYLPFNLNDFLLNNSQPSRRDLYKFYDKNNNALEAQILEYKNFIKITEAFINSDLKTILNSAASKVPDSEKIKRVLELQMLVDNQNDLTSYQKSKLKKLLPISQHKNILVKLYKFKDDFIGINEINQNNALQRQALKLKLDLYDLKTSIEEQLINDITDALTDKIDEKQPNKCDDFLAQIELKSILKAKNCKKIFRTQVQYAIRNILCEINIDSEDYLSEKHIENLTLKIKTYLQSISNSSDRKLNNISRFITQTIIQKNFPAKKNKYASYDQTIYHLSHSINNFIPKKIFSSLDELQSIERILENKKNHPIFRRNYEIKRQADSILKNIKKLFLGILLLPITGIVYLCKPKINGYQYKNFWSVWSGIKNGKFTNHTKGKDLAKISANMRNLIQEYKSKNNILNNTSGNQISMLA